MMTVPGLNSTAHFIVSVRKYLAFGAAIFLLGLVIFSAVPQTALAADCTFSGTTKIVCGGATYTAGGTSFPITYSDTATAGGQCAEANLVLASATATTAALTEYTAHPGMHDAVTCTSTTGSLTLGETYTAAAAANGGVPTVDPTVPTLTCNAGFNPLNWILCPAVNGMVNIANGLDDLVNGELSIGTNHNSGTNGTPTAIFGPCTTTPCAATGYKAAWTSFRDLALALLVIVALIVIVSTALGLEILDAYTIRKVLPRLVIIAAAISLSWNLLEFFITLTNDLGYGIRYIIYAPFTGPGFNQHINIGGGTGAAVVLIGGAGLVALGVFGLLLFALSAAITVAAGLVMLILRQVLVTGLIILSPIALVCYILPNTQKYYSQYAQLLGRAAIMGAIFEAVIAFGRVGAALALTDGSIINQFAAFIMYFGVYILVFSRGWQWGGAGMAAIGGAISKSTEGVQGSIKKKRSAQVTKNIAKSRTNSRYNDKFGAFKNPFTGNQAYLGHIGNRFATNIFDADETNMYRAGKYTPFFKRYKAFTDEFLTNRGANKAKEVMDHGGKMHYEAWGALAAQGLGSIGGMYGHYDSKTGEFTAHKDENGNDISIQQELRNRGFFDEKKNKWKAPETMKDIDTVAELMMESDNDKVREGGQDLKERAWFYGGGYKTENPEWAMTDVQAMASIGLAQAGRTQRKKINSETGKAKVDAEGNYEIFGLAEQGNELVGRLGASHASKIVNIAQADGQGLDPSIRKGHGIINRTVMKDGAPTLEYESSYTTDQRNEKGELTRKGNFDSATTRASITSLKEDDLIPMKSEGLDGIMAGMKHVALYGNGEGENDATKLQQAEEMRNTIRKMHNGWSRVEADAKIKWRKLSEEAHAQGYDLNIPGDNPSGPPPTAAEDARTR
jgi:hypothetical protein